jgi:hypothetical protein
LDALLDYLAPVSGTFFVAARGVGAPTGDYLLRSNLSPSQPQSRVEILPTFGLVMLGGDRCGRPRRP